MGPDVEKIFTNPTPDKVDKKPGHYGNLGWALGKTSIFSDSDKCAIKWQFRQYGDFYRNLFETLMYADDINLAKIAQVFPDEVQGFKDWRDGDLGTRVENEIGL